MWIDWFYEQIESIDIDAIKDSAIELYKNEGPKVLQKVQRLVNGRLGKTIGVVIGLLGTRYVILKLTSYKNYPPGPIGIPLLGFYHI